jgi:hypothetical protein
LAVPRQDENVVVRGTVNNFQHLGSATHDPTRRTDVNAPNFILECRVDLKLGRVTNDHSVTIYAFQYLIDHSLRLWCISGWRIIGLRILSHPQWRMTTATTSQTCRHATGRLSGPFLCVAKDIVRLTVIVLVRGIMVLSHNPVSSLTIHSTNPPIIQYMLFGETRMNTDRSSHDQGHSQVLQQRLSQQSTRFHGSPP